MDIPATLADMRRTVDRLLAEGHPDPGAEITMTAPLTANGGGSFTPDDMPPDEWMVDGPLALWPLTVDLLDISGNDNHLTPASGTYALTGDPEGAGLVGGGTFTSAAAFTGGSWTIEAVHSMMSPVGTGGPYLAIVTDGDDTSGAGIFLYDVGIGDAPWLLLPPTTNYDDLPYTTSYQRVHIAAVCDGSSTVLYVNGVAVTTSPDPAPAITPTGAGITVGGTYQAKRQIVLYDYALSSTRVAAHATAAGF